LTLDLIDIGANLTHASFCADLPYVMQRAIGAGVRRQIITGADLSGSREALALAQRHPGMLWSTAGVHPHLAGGFEAPQTEDLAALLAERCIVAVGECGLDYYRDLSPRTVQRKAFVAQLELAVTVRKPVFLHQRDAHGDFVAILRDFAAATTRGAFDCFPFRLRSEWRMAKDLCITDYGAYQLTTSVFVSPPGTAEAGH